MLLNSEPQFSKKKDVTEPADIEQSAVILHNPADETMAGPAEGGNGGKLIARIDQVRGARIIFGTVSLAVAIGYLVMALGMPQGTGPQPGAGMWPTAVGVAWVVISLIVITEAVFTQQINGQLDLPISVYRRDVIIFAVATVLYVLLLPFLGQYVVGTLYCIALVTLLSKLPRWKGVLYGLIMGLSISWFFLNLLQVRLPEGTVTKLFGI